MSYLRLSQRQGAPENPFDSREGFRTVKCRNLGQLLQCGPLPGGLAPPRVRANGRHAGHSPAVLRLVSNSLPLRSSLRRCCAEFCKHATLIDCKVLQCFATFWKTSKSFAKFFKVFLKTICFEKCYQMLWFGLRNCFCCDS